MGTVEFGGSGDGVEMGRNEKQLKAAVFYDLENLCMISKDNRFEGALFDLIKSVKRSELVDAVVLQKAYISKSHAMLARVREVMAKFEIELVEVEPVAGAHLKKANMVDFKMSVDLIASIAYKHAIKTVVVASGDKDFGFTCQQVKEMGRHLVVVSRYENVGQALLDLCDDWIDLKKQPLSAKFVKNAIASRVKLDLVEDDFCVAFKRFIDALEQNVLVKRYLRDFGLHVDYFLMLVGEFVKMPDHRDLGFKNTRALLTFFLSDTKFEIRGNEVKFSARKIPKQQHNLAEIMVNKPKGYSREKLLDYYDVLNRVENIDEMLTYVDFMKQNGMLTDNRLCYRRNYKSTIRKHAKQKLLRAGIEVDETMLTSLSETL